jgi:hypothetical protein
VGAYSSQRFAFLIDAVRAEFSWDVRDRFLVFLDVEIGWKRVMLGNGTGASRWVDVSVRTLRDTRLLTNRIHPSGRLHNGQVSAGAGRDK